MAQAKKNNAKVLIIIVAIIAVLFALIVVLTNQSNKSKTENNPYGDKDLFQSTIDQLDDENYQNITLPDQLAEKIEAGEKVFAYMFSPECSHCQNFTPKLMPIAEENNIYIDQVNVLEYTDMWQTYNVEATPTLILFEDGQEVTRLVGDQDESTVQAFFDSVQ